MPATYQWTGLGGNTNWDTPANWIGGTTFPSAAGDIAEFNSALATNFTVTVDGNFTIGQLLIGDPNGNSYSLVRGGAGDGLTFQGPSGTLLLSKTNAGAVDTIGVPLTLASNLTLDDNTASALSITASIGGTGTVTKTGSGTITLRRPQWLHQAPPASLPGVPCRTLPARALHRR